MFGSDFSCGSDFDQNWTFLAGDAQEAFAVAQALQRRLTTPRAAVPFWPNYGYDIRALVGATTTPTAAQISIEAECQKDERVSNVVADVVASGERWTIRIRVTLASGTTFKFTVSVDAVSVEFLKEQ